MRCTMLVKIKMRTTPPSARPVFKRTYSFDVVIVCLLFFFGCRRGTIPLKQSRNEPTINEYEANKGYTQRLNNND